MYLKSEIHEIAAQQAVKWWEIVSN